MQLVVNYPAQLPDALQQSQKQFEREAKMAMAAKLYELKRISSGTAAELVGIGRVEFLLNLHSYGVAVIDFSAEELLADFEHA